MSSGDGKTGPTWHFRQRYLAFAAEQVKRRAREVRQQREAFFRKLVLGPAGEINEDKAARKQYLNQLKWACLKERDLRLVDCILANPPAARAFTAQENPSTLLDTLKSVGRKSREPVPTTPPVSPKIVLDARCRKLLAAVGITPRFPISCKLFQLEFIPRAGGADSVTTASPGRVAEADAGPATFPKEVVTFTLPGDLAERLDEAGRFCGLTRGELVTELVRRRNPEALYKLLKLPPL